MADGEIVYVVKVDSSGAITEARQAGEEMGQQLNNSGSQHSSAWSEIWIGAARQIGAEIINLGQQAAQALGSAIVDITKQSVAQYAEYEQLAGGAELMFGDAYDYIADKAENAYSKVQMSQNDYLEQVNGFATGLKTSLGGNEQAAAELADKIITAEADIVAATGNSQEAVQNAFNGIMKGNYNMLDNLQIGIKPTKEGMQEVIDKMNEWNAAQGKVTNYTIDSLADCESAIVDYVSYVGMAGYAQNEGSKTLQGSFSTTKAAWENLLTGFAAGSEDLDSLLNAVIESGLNTVELALPLVESALHGIVELVAALAPELMELIPELVETLLPVIVAIIPDILVTIGQVVESILGYLVERFPDFITKGSEMLVNLMDGIGKGSSDTIKTITEVIGDILETLAKHLPEILEAGTEMLFNLLEGIIDNLPEISSTIASVIATLLYALVTHLPELVQAGVSLLGAIIEGIFQTIGSVVSVIGELATEMKDRFMNTDWSSIGSALIDGIVAGLNAGWSWLINTVRNLAKSVLQSAKNMLGIASPSKEFKFIGRMTTIGMEEGIEYDAPDLTRTVTTLYSSVIDDAEAALYNGMDIPTYLNQDIERNISTNLTATASTPDQTITVPLYLDGREIARATAWYTGEQLAWLEA